MYTNTVACDGRADVFTVPQTCLLTGKRCQDRLVSELPVHLSRVLGVSTDGAAGGSRENQNEDGSGTIRVFLKKGFQSPRNRPNTKALLDYTKAFMGAKSAHTAQSALKHTSSTIQFSLFV